MSMALHQSWLSCEHCDTLHQQVDLCARSVARCRCCGAQLYRADKPLNLLFALTLTSLLVLIMANAFPIVTLEVQGQSQASSLLDAVGRLYQQGMAPVAILVLITTLIFPASELFILAYISGSLLHSHRPWGFISLMRLLSNIRPWGMIEVFMLGILVALVKLTHVAHIIPGVALWAFGVLTLLLALVLSFDLHQLWQSPLSSKLG